MNGILRKTLDSFYFFRRFLVNLLAFITLYIYGKEVKWIQVKNRIVSNREKVTLNLDEARDLTILLELAKKSVNEAENRRNQVTEKCKTLFTVGSLLIAVCGVLLPKYFVFDSILLRSLSVFAIFALFIAIFLLISFFDIGQEMYVSLSQDDVMLDEANLKKSLINRHLNCAAHIDNRTDYLVELYCASRFCFQSALAILTAVAIIATVCNSSGDQTYRVDLNLRADSK